MNCSDISALAPIYLSGELDAARAQDFAAHLGNCAACKRELGQQSAFDELLRNSVLAEPVYNTHVDQRVRESIRAERKTAHRWRLAVAAIAAVLLLAIIGYRALFTARNQPVYAAAARDHRLELVDNQPRKWITDRAAIATLAERQGLPGSVISTYAPAGYHLAQGKLCYLDGRVFLHLVYANDAGSFSLFLRQHDDTATSGVQVETFARERVAGFEKAQLTVLIVGEGSSDQAVLLAKSAEAAL
jgi:anti-sigma factor RsiW